MKVIVTTEGLSYSDFTRSGCDEALASCPRRWNDDYLMALYDLRMAAEATGNKKTVAVCILIHAVLASRPLWSRTLPPDEDDAILPTYQFDDGAFIYLRQILEYIADDETRARAADLLYQRSVKIREKRDITVAKTAVSAYLGAATRLEQLNNYHWVDAENRVERAFIIAAKLRNTALKQEVVAHIERAVSIYTPVPTQDSSGKIEGRGEAKAPSRYTAVLMKLLLRFEAGDPNRYSVLAEHLAQEALATNQWELGREYLDVSMKWYGRLGEVAKELVIQERAAESWIQEAEKLVQRRDMLPYGYLLAEHRLRNGIEALKGTRGKVKARGLSEEECRLTRRIEEVRRQHLRYQEYGVAALVPIQVSDTIDSGPILAVVEGKSKLEALRAMVMFPLRAQADVEKEVREEMSTHLIFSLFGLVQMDERGHNTARTKDTKTDADLWARICQRTVMFYEIAAQCHVGPLISRIVLDHAVEVKDFAKIANASCFVPAGRGPLFARGLYAGMKGNFSLALHLLIPQIEHAARQIVRTAFAADKQMAVDYREMLANPDAPSLGQILQHSACEVELARVIGSETVFALRVILVERFGGNLRNRTFHGLIENNGLQGWLCWYFWWLVLKICWETKATVEQA